MFLFVQLIYLDFINLFKAGLWFRLLIKVGAKNINFNSKTVKILLEARMFIRIITFHRYKGGPLFINIRGYKCEKSH